MHPDEFRELARHLTEVYAAQNEKILKLERRIKQLTEELTKVRMTHPAPRPPQPPAANALKRGSDWSMEGDFLVDLSVQKRLRFPCPITNVRVSAQGQIAFSLNKKVVVLNQGQFYVVEDYFRLFDPYAMKDDLSETQRCIFDFIDEALIVFSRNCLLKYADGKKAWSVPLNNVYHICCSEGLIYAATREYKIYIFKENECVSVVDYQEPMRYFIVRRGMIFGHTENKLVILSGKKRVPEGRPGSVDPNASVFMTDCGRILALDYAEDHIYFGGESCRMKYAQVSTGLQNINSFSFPAQILAIKKWREFVVVSCQDKSLNILNVESDKCMRIMGRDNVVDMAVNEHGLYCVGNNGMLRVWQLNID
ncbi:hypothetical protein ENBRE01_0579 [Enteropsectra breve]|nr:hypothetical protein ENBRE01_0579 [Enteropsectra breve]